MPTWNELPTEKTVMIPSQWRHSAVSYTHLDVYKRQSPRRPAGRCTSATTPRRSPACLFAKRLLSRSTMRTASSTTSIATPTWATARSGVRPTTKPVSYTHLDVYKRQGAYSVVERKKIDCNHGHDTHPKKNAPTAQSRPRRKRRARCLGTHVGGKGDCWEGHVRRLRPGTARAAYHRAASGRCPDAARAA